MTNTYTVKQKGMTCDTFDLPYIGIDGIAPGTNQKEGRRASLALWVIALEDIS